jgi:hypothetical protein
MSNPSRPKSVVVAAASALLLASLAMAGTPAAKEKRPVRIKKDANGTVSFKAIAVNTSYKSEREVHAEVQDPVRRAQIKAEHYGLTVAQEYNGGHLNGKVEIGDSWVDFDVTGDGTQGTFQHTIKLPARFEVHSAPNNPGAEIDTFATDMNRIEGQSSSGDGVFEYIRLVGGTANGYPSPGQMTIISRGDVVEVDSFFNVGFRLEFKGAAGGPLDGIEDSMEGSVIMRAHQAESSASSTVKPARPAKERGSASRQR